jgi:hypothetical protein
MPNNQDKLKAATGIYHGCLISVAGWATIVLLYFVSNWILNDPK